jgi:hypothetical protein
MIRVQVIRIGPLRVAGVDEGLAFDLDPQAV